MRKIIVFTLLFCCCFPVLTFASEISHAPEASTVQNKSSFEGIQPVSVDALSAKVTEAEGYVLGAMSPIIKLLAKIMLLLIALSFIGILLTGAQAAKNAFVAFLFVGIGMMLFTIIPQLTEWFINLGNWLAN